MDELTLDNKKYLSSKKAAQITGYAKDYVGQLCREGRIEARLVGRNWYVLETSILEHRFGAAEEEKQPEKKIIPATEAWETPRYIPETVVSVPELVPKPAERQAETVSAAPEANKMLSDMQSAWREWIDTQKKSEPALPDASEMLLEPGEMASGQVISNDDDFFPVRIARHEEPEAQLPLRKMEIEEGNTARMFEMRPLTAAPQIPIREESPVVAVRTQRKRRERPQRLKTKRYGAVHRNFVQNAIMLSLAGLAVVIALIGSGLADAYLPNVGIGTSITDFFSGTQNIK